MRFTIYHTNDIHSRFESFAKIVSELKCIRSEEDITLDAGDFNDFMRLELQGTQGKIGAELLRIAGYDAITVGNNEGFEGISILKSMAEEGISFLSCNLHQENGLPIEGVRRSVFLKKKGIRFLVIGVTPPFNEFFSLLQMNAFEPSIEIKKEIESNKGKYDICILLSHLGITTDMKLAEQIEHIDIIIGGHSHTLMEEPIKVKNTVIHQSGNYGEYLGALEIEYEDGIKNYSGKNIKINEEEDRDIISALKEGKKRAITFLGKPLYCIPMDLWHDVVEENSMTNLLADALRDRLQCDVGLINSGVLNGGIRKGIVSKKKLLEICPSPLNPTFIELKGKQLREALQFSLDTEICMSDGRGGGFRGKYLGRLHVSGAKIIHDGGHITDIFIGNKKLDDEAWYTVATSDYLQRGTGYTSLKQNRNERYNPEYLRDLLSDYLCKQQFIDNANKDRWMYIGDQ